MLNITIKGNIPVLHMFRYSRAVQTQMKTEFRNCVRAFVLTAAPAVPVQSGMARGSYLNLARAVGVNLVITPRPIMGKNGKPKKGHGYYIHKGRRYKKTPEMGTRFTRQNVSSARMKNTMSFSTDISYYTLQEFTAANSPTSPWESFEKGRDAFFDCMQRIKIPDLKKYIVKTRISTTRGSLSQINPIRNQRTI